MLVHRTLRLVFANLFMIFKSSSAVADIPILKVRQTTKHKNSGNKQTLKPLKNGA
jgi:hypothetical protein